MDDETVFQNALDANPDDFTTRLVFADWLQERGDERAEGFRAMVRLSLYQATVGPFGASWIWFNGPNYTTADREDVPECWFFALEQLLAGTDDERMSQWECVEGVPGYWHEFKTCRSADRALALAWLRLTDDERAELLAAAEVPA